MKKKIKKRSLILIFAAVAVAAVCIVVAVIVFSSDNSSKPEQSLSRVEGSSTAASQSESKAEKPNPLTGTWEYIDGTRYRFNEDYSGAMLVKKVVNPEDPAEGAKDEYYEYRYTYKIDGNNLSIDYKKEEVRDAEYTFEAEANSLKLIGGKGTAKGEYEMSRVS